MRRAPVAAAVAVVCLAMPAWAAAEAPPAYTIRVESTTDTVDAGLFDGLLKPMYAQKFPGDTLQYTAVGTGKAVQDAEAGKADVVITHAPALEAQFVQQGYSLGLGRQIFYSDYVVVGPRDDPAHVAANDPHNAVGAFQDIAHAGDAHVASPATAPDVRFDSRGDNSGTNGQEQVMWGLTDGTVTKSPAGNGAGDTTRFEPGTGGPNANVYPAWYQKTGAGQAANLNQAEACAAAGQGCYTLIDRGTFNKAVNGGTVTHLKIVSQKNTAGVPGGENLLVNPFSIYIVNPAKITTPPAPNADAGRRLVDFITSPEFQDALESFPTAVDPAFRPDAAPGITLSRSLPPTALTGSTITVSGRATNDVPGAAEVAGMPVQAEVSGDNGATWTNAGAPATTDAHGTFSRNFVVTQPGTYRVALATPEQAASFVNGTAYNAFTPATTVIGTLAVTSPAAATPTPVSVRDTKKPTVTKLSLGRRSLRLHVSEASRIKLVLQRRVKRHHRFKWVSVQTVRASVAKARTIVLRHKRLHAGRYRLGLTVTDTAGNTRKLTRTFTLH